MTGWSEDAHGESPGLDRVGLEVGEEQMLEGGDQRCLIDIQSIEGQSTALLATGSAGAKRANGSVGRETTKLDLFERPRRNWRNLRPMRDIVWVESTALAESTIRRAMLELKRKEPSGERIKALFVEAPQGFGHPVKNLTVE